MKTLQSWLDHQSNGPRVHELEKFLSKNRDKFLYGLVYTSTPELGKKDIIYADYGMKVFFNSEEQYLEIEGLDPSEIWYMRQRGFWDMNYLM